MVPLLTALDRASFDLQRHGALVLYPSAAAPRGTPTILHATTNRFTIRRQRVNEQRLLMLRPLAKEALAIREQLFVASESQAPTSLS